MSEPDILIRQVGHWGHITLNRPRALNALSYPMCCAIDDALAGWERDADIIGVLIDGVGERGFCAGGDIRALYASVQAGKAADAAIFFAREYRLNARIARFPKPYVALMDGITMGGGVGLSAHGSHRVVTERSVIAMPEATIGFIPDIGATWLLGRIEGELGMHAALTAARLTGADAIATGLADAYVPGSRLAALRDAILATDTIHGLRDAIDHEASPPPPSDLLAQADWIARCYAANTAEAIADCLAAAGPPARAAAAALAAQSPTSIKLILRALRAARAYGALEPCLQQEYRIALTCLANHDFAEGVRAAVIDKDRTPHWQPATLADVSDDALAPYFASLGAAELNFDFH